MTYATGFCNAISVLILRREPSPFTCRKTDRFYDGRPPMTLSRHYRIVLYGKYVLNRRLVRRTRSRP